MAGRVLHLLSQRPSRTGSGVTLEALVRGAARAGWDQHVAVGTPADDGAPTVAELEPTRVHPLVFGRGRLGFPLPGMSDVMPYPSSRFSRLTEAELDAYRDAWRKHVGALVARLRPDVIHAHHVWLLSALVKAVAPDTPLVVHGHATGLRQLELCPHLADEVRRGCARADALLALHTDQARAMAEQLGVPPERVTIVGAGYAEDVFAPGAGPPDPRRASRLLYVGKLSAAKGVPWLLDAFERLAATAPDVELHLASGVGDEEGAALQARARALPGVVAHGALPRAELAELMTRCAVCVLPSLYEGLPLVLVEAHACGCRLVATALPGITQALAPRLGDALQLVTPPVMLDIDTPDPADLPRFVTDLTATLRAALSRTDAPPRPVVLRAFTWGAVFERIEAVWKSVTR